jgi:cytochrome c553
MKGFVALPALLAAFAVHAAEQPAAAAKPDPAKGKQIAVQVCAGCHAEDGNSVAPVNPKLAGQVPDYLYKQLRNFKAANGKPAERQNPIMNGMVAALSEEDMKAVAAHFASQKLNPEMAKNKGTMAQGQTLYRAGNADKGIPACAGCHGPAGEGMPAQYPRLSGQFADYLEAQLRLFRSGERANDPAKMMRMIAAKMSDAEIKAVSDYMAGLR